MAETEFENPSPGYYALGIEQYQAERSNRSSWFATARPVVRVGKTVYIFKVE
jgi:hypothetical protein